jgi:hypothetical protein
MSIANFIVQSVGGLFDEKILMHRPHSRMFPTAGERIAAGYALGNDSDLPAIDGTVKIGLEYHGTETYRPDSTPNLRQRGSIKRRDDGVWVVKVPTGIKTRKIHEHTFDFSDVRSADLHTLIPLKTGNAKVKKTAAKLSEQDGVKYRPLALNLPALLACPMAGECERFCFALQGSYVYASVRDARARTMAVLHEAYRRGGVELVADVIGAALDANKPRKGKVLIRIHDSGDFFARWYWDALGVALAARADWVTPYGYTKRIDFVRASLQGRAR